MNQRQEEVQETVPVIVAGSWTKFGEVDQAALDQKDKATWLAELLKRWVHCPHKWAYTVASWVYGIP